MTLPLFVLYYCFDFPLFTQLLVAALIAAILVWESSEFFIYLLAIGLFYFSPSTSGELLLSSENWDNLVELYPLLEACPEE